MKYLIIALLVLFFSCKENEINGIEYTVIDYEKTSWMSLYKNAKSTELTNNEIVEIEKIIEERISKTIESYNRNWNELYPNLKNTTKFRRQYVPMILENGDKIVWINFFCFEPENDKWKSEIISVRDGGNCFFNIKVNLTKKEYFDFYVNGIAENIKPLYNNGYNPLLNMAKTENIVTLNTMIPTRKILRILLATES
jgi:hypothetical protein